MTFHEKPVIILTFCLLWVSVVVGEEWKSLQEKISFSTLSLPSSGLVIESGDLQENQNKNYIQLSRNDFVFYDNSFAETKRIKMQNRSYIFCSGNTRYFGIIEHTKTPTIESLGETKLTTYNFKGEELTSMVESVKYDTPSPIVYFLCGYSGDLIVYNLEKLLLHRYDSFGTHKYDIHLSNYDLTSPLYGSGKIDISDLDGSMIIVVNRKGMRKGVTFSQADRRRSPFYQDRDPLLIKFNKNGDKIFLKELDFDEVIDCKYSSDGKTIILSSRRLSEKNRREKITAVYDSNGNYIGNVDKHAKYNDYHSGALYRLKKNDSQSSSFEKYDLIARKSIWEHKITGVGLSFMDIAAEKGSPIWQLLVENNDGNKVSYLNAYIDDNGRMCEEKITLSNIQYPRFVGSKYFSKMANSKILSTDGKAQKASAIK